MGTSPLLTDAPQGNTSGKEHSFGCAVSSFTFFLLCRNSHESVHSLATKTVSCVSVHPVYKHYMAVSESQYDGLDPFRIRLRPVIVSMK